MIQKITFIVFLALNSYGLTAQTTTKGLDKTESTQNKNKVKLSLAVEGAKSNKGVVLVAVINSKEAYDDNRSEPFAQASLSLQDQKAKGQFELPPGEYVVRLFHDENSNGELDTNFLGIPTETYGFSNNAPARFGPPSYEDAKVVVSKENSSLLIKLK